MGATSETKDVFISYRRNGGATVARLLCDVLNQRNISTFFDKESLGEGDFDNAIEKNLHAARNFILIVSPGLFDRGITASGQYDNHLTESDWVYREIRIALETGKPIIPIFVNGEQSFPTFLPPGIESISRKDTLTLSHDHFEPELRKLISRLKTNKDLLIESYLKNTQGEEQDNILLDTCHNLAGAKRATEITQLLSSKARQLLNEETRNNQDAIDAILKDANIGFAKKLCKDLGVDNTGDFAHLKQNLSNWIENRSFKEFSLEAESNDRFYTLVNIFGDFFKSHEDRRKAIELAGKMGIAPDTTRSSYDIYYDIFDTFGVAGFFENYRSRFPSNELKYIAYTLLPNESSWKKSDLIGQIIDYVNYVFTPEDLD